VGIPHLSLREVTPLHPNSAVLDAVLSTEEPCVLFEDKVLYTERVWRDGVVDNLFRYELRDGPAGVGVVYPDGIDDVDFVAIATGGTVLRTHAAARALLLEQDIVGRVVVPSQLYPLDLTPFEDLLGTARAICVVEEGTGGGTWGAEVAHRIHQAFWRQLRGPVRLVHSAESVIPTAPHLERQVLADQSAVYHTVVEALTSGKGTA
jgi:pyruvate dehydrogenase E1 component beta subunit